MSSESSREITELDAVARAAPVESRSVLADRYVVLDRLGEGGAGTVFAAYDRVLRAEVAVKCVGRVSGDSLFRFKSEFRAVQSLAHPNLIGLGELFEVAGDWFYSMERVDGTTFVRNARPRAETDSPATGESTDASESESESATSVGDVSDDRTVASGSIGSGGRVAIDRKLGTLDVGVLRHTFAQLCEAIAVIHRSGRLHRDLKPANVLVTRTGRVVVLDFGLSVRLTEDGHAALEEGILGTPGYMAPEQAFGTHVTPAADAYALGVVLYECLTGRRPFLGKTEDVLVAKRDLDPVAPSAIVADVPADLEALALALLQRDPAARPTIDDVRRRLRGASVQLSDEFEAPDPDDAGEVFVGRDPELDRILAAYEATRREHAERVVLLGPSGIGKSALLREALRRIEQDDGAPALVLRGRCYERERVAYNAVDELVDQLSDVIRGELSPREQAAIVPPDAAYLVRAFPVLRRVAAFEARSADVPTDDAIESKRRSFGAFRALVAALARRRRMVLVLEDLQWADADSWSLLAECVREPDAPPVLLLATARSELLAARLSPAAEGILAGATRVELGVLGRGDALALARRLGGSDADAHERLVAASDGHPLFLELLARRRHGGAREGGAASTVHGALWELAESQSETARSLLACCAVAARPTSASALRDAAAIDAGEFHRALRELRSSNLVRVRHGEGREEIETYHDQVRDAVLARLTPERILAVHGLLADALLAEGAEPEGVYRHLFGAGRLVEGRAAAIRAGERASDALAFDQAASAFDAAMTGLADADVTRLDLARRRADALAGAGRGEIAGRAYLELAEHLPPDDALLARQRAAIELIGAGVYEDGKAALARVMASLGMRFPRSSVTAVMGLLAARMPLVFTRLATIRPTPRDLAREERMRLEIAAMCASAFSVTDPFLGGYFASVYLRLAVAAGDAAHLAAALANEATATAYMGKDDDSDALFARSSAIADEVAAVRTTAFLRGCEAAIELIRLRDLRKVQVAARRSIAAYREVKGGGHLELRAIRLLEGNAYSIGGLYRKLDEVAEANVASARSVGDSLSLASWLVEYAVSLRWLVADAPDGLEASLAEAQSLSAMASPFLRYQVAITSSWLDLYRGDDERAFAALTPRLDALGSSLALKAPILGCLSAWCRARTALAGSESLSPAAAEKLHKRARAEIRTLKVASQPLCRAWSDQLEAALAIQRGERDLAATAMRRSIAGFDGCRARGYAAAARVQLGALVSESEGREPRAAGLRYLVEQGVKNPARFVSALLPGARALVAELA